VRILPAFWPVSQRGQIILFLPTMCEDCAHSVMSKSSKQVPNIIENGKNVIVIFVYVLLIMGIYLQVAYAFNPL
jgi:hypothetical protein